MQVKFAHNFISYLLLIMKKSQFNYFLPDELIAQYPLHARSDSRLLSYNRKTGEKVHCNFRDLPRLLNAGDLLVLNDSRVMHARLFGFKETGGKVQLLVERILNDREFFAHIKASKSLKSSSLIILDNNWQISIVNKADGLYHCQANDNIFTILDEIGHIPLPPYIDRQDESVDLHRYQTIYAKNKGSVAAPTAGLHFDDDLFLSLKNKGINIAFTTLHIGAGTFQPVRCDFIQEHKMHTEVYNISKELCAAVRDTKMHGGRVIAVGTTAMRSLESAMQSGELIAGTRDTNIFITPGYEFKICDGLITNFHLPESTLLMLVSAFIGYNEAMKLYQYAIEHKYRFYSYGDASLLL